MSAYIVSKEHIDLLVSAGLRNQSDRLRWFDRTDLRTSPAGDSIREHSRELDYSTADQTGAMLWLENVRSVSHRYQGPDVDSLDTDTTTDVDLPGPIGLTLAEVWGYTHHGIPAFASEVPPVAVLKALDCFEYQACEHDGWHDSEARSFVEALRGRMIRQLPGYAEAEWEVSV